MPGLVPAALEAAASALACWAATAAYR
jgi:hypothetical protein